jgi:hypothetical protein
MAIRTKEKYDRIHAPLKPKSRVKKKAKLIIIDTVRNPIKKLIPFIPDKDKSPKPVSPRTFKRNINPLSLLEMFIPSFKGGKPIYPSSLKGAKKHAGEVRRIKKNQRRRAYLRLCR